MEERYKNYSIDEIAEEYDNGNAGISLEELAELYHFPSTEILKEALTKYNKEHRKGRLKLKMNFTEEEKDYIYYLYDVKKYSIKRIADMASTSIYSVGKVLKEKNPDIFINRQKDLKSKTKILLKSKKDSKNVKYGVKKITPPNKKVEIPIEELVEAVKTNNIESIMQKYDTSYSTVRKRLVETYGENYIDILRGNPVKAELEEYGKMYEDGITNEQIAKIKGISEKEVKKKINHYYKLNGSKRPKIMSKELFEEEMNKNDDIEKLIAHFSEMNIHIPEPYIKDYYKKTDGVDLRIVKNIVRAQLTKIKDEGVTPNYTSPFEFANKVKAKGFGTKYQACAILYKMIEENDLSSDIVLPLDNDNLTQAIKLLIDDKKTNNPEYMKKLKNNDLAHVIYSMQIQNFNNIEKSLDD